MTHRNQGSARDRKRKNINFKFIKMYLFEKTKINKKSIKINLQTETIK